MAKFYTSFFVLITLLLCNNEAFANVFTKEEIKSSLPKMLGSSNVGREFYITFIPAWEMHEGDMRLYITSEIKTKVVVSVKAKGKTYTSYTIPNDIIEFIIPPSIALPYRKTDRDIPENDKVYPGYAVHITSDDPIICYGVVRYSYMADGFLALPVNVLGKEYIASSWEDPADNTLQWLTSYSAVVSAYDSTKVRFTFGGNKNSRTVSGLKPGESSNWNMNAGDVLLIGAIGTHSDVTGSKVVSSKPVAVITGNFCAYIPTNCGCCDYITEMELPTNTWGQEYHVTNIIGRKKNSYIRVFAKDSNTKVFRDGIQIGTIRDAGGMDSTGWLSFRVGDSIPKPYVISADKPISVTQYNTAQSDDTVRSDPFQMILIPTIHYQKEIMFSTPGIRGGYGFPMNYINICYQANDDGTMPDDIEFAEVVSGQFNWIKLKALSPAMGDEFAVKTNGKRYFTKTIQLPHDGAYKLKANAPFAVYSYGWSSYDSYGFPASIKLSDFFKKDSIPPDPKWTMTCDGSVNSDKMTTVKDMPDDDTNRSNLGYIYMRSYSSFNYKFFVSDFIPGQDRETKWWLEVIDKTKDACAVITFRDQAENDTTITINYIPSKLTISPPETKWDISNKYDVKEKMFCLVNNSIDKEVVVSSLSLSQNTTGFKLTDVNGGLFSFPIVIQKMDSLPFKITFTSANKGIYKDSIIIKDTCVILNRIPIECEVGAPIIKVADWYFGYIPIGNKGYHNLSIKNLGATDLIITGYSGPMLQEYSIESGLIERNISITNPLIIPYDSDNEVTYRVGFKPNSIMKYNDSITFFSNTDRGSDLVDSIARLAGYGSKPIDVEQDYSDFHYLNISPNPSDGNATIEFNLVENASLMLYNELGIGFEIPFVAGVNRVNLKTYELSSGVYHLVLRAGAEIVVRKLLIQR